jgi:Flp pilus assembly protein TadG
MIPAAAQRRAELRRRGRGQAGAALVEFALVAMVLLVICASTFDYGFAWRAGLAVNEGARSGARVGSSQSLSKGADYYALNSVRATLLASGAIDQVEKVVIFKSTTANGRVPASCLLNSPSGTCNVLTGAQLEALTLSSYNLVISPDPNVAPTGTGCLNANAAQRVGWCPNARSNNQETGADYYGVYIELKYPRKFKFPGSSIKVTRTAVMRLEPVGFGA